MYVRSVAAYIRNCSLTKYDSFSQNDPGPLSCDIFASSSNISQPSPVRSVMPSEKLPLAQYS